MTPTRERSIARLLSRVIERFGFDRDWHVNVFGAIVGVVTALGAIGFATALHAAEDWTNAVQARSAWWMLLVIPMAGALITGLLVHLFARDAKGHGVPQVLDAIARKRGYIPARVGIVKVIASISTVGSGGSGGAEGPIIQIGSTAGSAIGRWLGIGREHMGTLLGCGAAAGIASIFNAPIAGVFFAMEILLRDFSLRTFTPIVIASVFSAALTQLILGKNDAIFAVELPDYVFTPAELPSFIVLGLVCAMLAWGLTCMLHVGEDRFPRLRVHPAVRPVVGAAMLGTLAVIFTTAAGQSGAPAFYGNGYDTITWLLEPATYAAAELSASGLHAGIVILLALTVCKVLATTFTLASGGSGGVFAPSLFVGATGGAAFGMALDTLGLLPAGATPASYALVGMAAVVAGTTFAPLTAILLLFELTREPLVLAPIMLAAIVSTSTARRLMPDSIYTARLRRSGVLIGTGRDLTLLRRLEAASVAPTPLPAEPVYASDPLSKLIGMHATHNVPDFPVVDSEGRYIGMVTGADVRTALIDREAIPLLLVAELLRDDLPTIRADESLDSVLDKFAAHDVASLCLVDDSDAAHPLHLVTRNSVMKRYQDALARS